MATVNDSIPHVVRTAEDPRQQGVWTARLSRIEQVNPTIRLLRLSLPKDGPPLRHLPGQYIDLSIPDIPVVGGFTITSAPQTALPSQPDPYIELAIQASPENPPAAFVWRPVPEILDAQVSFRVGGNFVYPPPTLGREDCEQIDRAVFVAGGVGVNPIMSMISAMETQGPERLGGMPRTMKVLYTSRRGRNAQSGEGEEILFEKRLADMAARWKGHKSVDYKYTLFVTTGGDSQAKVETEESDPTTGGAAAFKLEPRRITQRDLADALGPEDERRNTVVYVCGLPDMTDDFVAWLQKQPGMDEKRVLCEKWW